MAFRIDSTMFLLALASIATISDMSPNNALLQSDVGCDLTGQSKRMTKQTLTTSWPPPTIVYAMFTLEISMCLMVSPFWSAWTSHYASIHTDIFKVVSKVNKV